MSLTRLRRIPLTAQFLLDALKTSNRLGPFHMRVISNPLPQDATFVRAGHDAHGLLWIVFASDTFDELSDGSPIPEHPTPVVENEPCPKV